MIEAYENLFHLTAGGVSYIIGVEDGVPVTYYWGKALCDPQIGRLVKNPAMCWSVPAETQCMELPVSGKGDFRTPLLELQFADGSRVTDFRYQGHSVRQGKPLLQGLPATWCENPEDAQTLILELQDPLKKVRLTAQYTIWQSGVLTRSLLLQNSGAEPVLIRRMLSASVDFQDDRWQTLTLQGAWARENHVERSPLFHGCKTISSVRGASSHHKNPFMALVRPYTTEHQGEVYAMNLVYSGNFVAAAELSCYEMTRLQIGINFFDFAWNCAPNQTFQTPEAVLVYSDRGLNGMSQKFHRLYREHLCRGAYRTAPRPLLVNNWEATYFDFDEQKLIRIARNAQKHGLELFVLDDGWFGKRDSDTCSLGDWVVDRKKLPGGLAPFAEKLGALGLKFGLWFEPEMVSPDSELYRAHPDWCIHTKGRARTELRQQLVLDLSRPEVCTYLVQAVAQVLQSADIQYVKWDMNRSMTELPYLDTAHSYMLGLYRVLEELTARFPRVLWEGCSGGGGRFDAGMLYYMPQIWTSDDTDANERVQTQYGTSLVYPLCTMDNNLSAVPNHQTGRSSSFQTRGNVAMFGNFGYQLDLDRLSEEESRQMEEQVTFYKTNRALFAQGDFYRLESPYENNTAAWSVVSQDQCAVLLFAYQKLAMPNQLPQRIRLAGLNPTLRYRSEDGTVDAAGDVLMNVGIAFPGRQQDFDSVVLKLNARPR